MTGPADVAWSYFERINEGRLDDALALLDDAGTYWQNGTRAAAPMAQVKRLMAKVLAAVPLQFTLVTRHEDGDTAVLELTSHGLRPDGVAYDNAYCFVVTVADGRIAHLREHADTVAAAELLGYLSRPS